MLSDEIEEALGGGAMQPVGRERRRRASAAQPVQGGQMMYDWRGEGLVNNAAGVAGVMHQAQGRQLMDTAGRVSDAIGDENSRRVAMAREMRRMEHERSLKAMEQETERMKIDALLQRLRAEGGPRVSGPGFAIY